MNKQYNLLFIMTDQQRFDAMSFAGNKLLHTPNMDRLAEEGVFFTAANTHCPVCVPSRTSILTGRCIDNTEIKTNKERFLRDGYRKIQDLKTFDEILAERGYYCEYHGKWHAPICRASAYNGFTYKVNEKNNSFAVGEVQEFQDWLDKNSPFVPCGEGEQLAEQFNRSYVTDIADTRHGMPPGYVPEYGNEEGQADKFEQMDCGRLNLDEEYTLTAFTAKKTMEALKNAKEVKNKSGRPFSVTCSFYAPHVPFTSPEKYYGMFNADDMPVPESINDTNKDTIYGKRGFAITCGEPDKLRQMTADYYAMVAEIDDWLGKIIKTLEDIGEAEDTLIVFTSDHGELLGAHGGLGKLVFFEESLRIPLILKMPGVIKAGHIINEPVSSLDYYATILEYLLGEHHDSDGYSLKPLIENGWDEAANGEKYITAQWNQKSKNYHYCVRTKDWKYITTEGGVGGCLFNLTDDPFEMNNLIINGNESDMERLETLKGYLNDYFVKTRGRGGFDE
jgi:arylsulfatase A-like enzyme